MGGGRPRLYILCGLPFAGKTVLAAALRVRLCCAVVSVDELRFARGFPWVEDSPITAADWQAIFAEAEARTLQHLAAGSGVVYDCANLDRAGRLRLCDMAASAGYPARLILVAAPVELVRERWLRNRATRERFDLPEALFESALAAFEPPGPDEDPVVYRSGEDVAGWMRAHWRAQA